MPSDGSFKATHWLGWTTLCIAEAGGKMQSRSVEKFATTVWLELGGAKASK